MSYLEWLQQPVGDKPKSSTSEDQLRQTGRTTKSIKNAPINSLYVCVSTMESKIIKEIAKKNDRSDITVCAVRDLLGKELYKSYPTLVFDHAVPLIYYNMPTYSSIET